MKKNVKEITRATALTLASVLCFSACGNQQTDVSQASSEEKESVSQVSSAEDTPEEKPYWEMLDEVSDTSELPDWTGDTLEINIWFAAGNTGMVGEIPKTDVAFKEFERVTGVKINVDESYDNGGNSIDAKLPMVVASDDFPTIIMGYNIGQQMEELYENGYLADLTEYYNNGDLDQLTKWFPLEEMQTSVYANCRNEEGEYYLLPYGESNADTLTNVFEASGYIPEVYDREYYAKYGTTPTSATGLKTTTGFVVRDDILKALKPDALSRTEIEQIYMENGEFTEEQIYSVKLNSAEEFYDFLRDIKELLGSGEYVGLDGKPMEVTYGPNTELDNWYWMCYLPEALAGFPSMTNYFAAVDFTADDSSELLTKAFLHEDYVKFMRELNVLVREDLISQNSLLDNKVVFEEKCKNGHYAVGYTNTDMLNHEGTDDWRYVPIWVNVPYNEDFGAVSSANYIKYFGIFKDALSDEELEQLIHAINYLNSVAGMNNFFWGPESAGLFTVDADGNRTYTDEELRQCMIENVDNGAAKKYGLINHSVVEKGFDVFPVGTVYSLLTPKYVSAEKRGLNVADATRYYNPGTLPGCSVKDYSVYLSANSDVYGSMGLSVDGLEQFWAARNGFENQLKKVIVAESDAEFEEQLEVLKVYAEENGFTDEALAEFNDMFVEANQDALKKYGIIE